MFGNFGGGASIRVELQSSDFAALNNAALSVSDLIQANLPDSRIDLNPDPQIVSPEYRLLPNDRRLAEVGMNRDMLARTLRAFGDGLWLGEFFMKTPDLIFIYAANNGTDPNN